MSMQTPSPTARRKIRCAIYTRKSTEDGLEQDFNSLDAQREACEAYVTSQKAEGWVLVADRFDDGGLSGGTLERPALRRLLNAVEARQIDQIIVYKIDRLTRSLSDFSKIVDRLDAVEATFVSVTQAFNTATSMGQLTLNMLLSFAQFEREVTAERIRNKIAASKKKGLWMGGSVPLGYLPEGRTLKIDAETAPVVGRLYELYQAHRSINAVTVASRSEGLKTRIIRNSATGHQRGGNPFTRGHIYQILTNPIYAGRIRHHKVVYDGQQPALIAPNDWDALQGMLSEDAARTRGVGNAGARAPLCGKIYDEQGETLTPTHTTKSGKRIRYYISRCLVTGKAKDHPNAWRLPAVALEDQMAGLIQTRLSTPSVIAALLPTGTASDLHEVTERAQTPASKLGGYQSDHTLELVEHIALSSGRVTVTLNMSQITTALDCSIDQLDASCLAWSAPFSLKRRGVETRLTLGSENAHVDPVLIRNVQRARDWYQQIVAGHTFSKITSESGVDKNRLKQILQLAFLAPDLLARITSGTQPNGFTSEWLKTNTLPTQWDAQRALFERL